MTLRPVSVRRPLDVVQLKLAIRRQLAGGCRARRAAAPEDTGSSGAGASGGTGSTKGRGDPQRHQSQTKLRRVAKAGVAPLSRKRWSGGRHGDPRGQPPPARAREAAGPRNERHQLTMAWVDRAPVARAIPDTARFIAAAAFAIPPVVLLAVAGGLAFRGGGVAAPVATRCSWTRGFARRALGGRRRSRPATLDMANACRSLGAARLERRLVCWTVSREATFEHVLRLAMLVAAAVAGSPMRRARGRRSCSPPALRSTAL